MTGGVSEELLARLQALVAMRLGLHFPKERYRNLERGLAAAACELHFADSVSFLSALLAAPVEAHLITLAGALTTGETYFFRDRRIFEILEERILPEWISIRRSTTRHLRIWSAGCCTGEEAYSLAILIHKMIPDLTSWQITILGTDINARFLEKAAAGVYTEWSFRSAPVWLKERYFKKLGQGRYEIIPQVRGMVKFSQLNLAEYLYPSPSSQTVSIDLILCRNVLMYFIPWQIQKVVDGFHRCLNEGGWLIVSPSEISFVQSALFSMVNFPGAMLHQRMQGLTDAGKAPGFATDFDRVLNVDLGYSAIPKVLENNRIIQGPGANGSEPGGAFPSLPRENPELPRVLSCVPQAPVETFALAQPLDSGPPPGSDLVALYREGRYAELADQLSGRLSACRIKPETDFGECDPFALLVKAYANLGDLEKAVEWCDRGIALDKLNPLLRYLRALVLQEQGQLEEALAALRQAIYLDPRFVLGHFALGNVAQKLGRMSESQKHFANTVTLLNGLNTGETLPESEGITVGGLLEMMRSALGKEKMK